MAPPAGPDARLAAVAAAQRAHVSRAQLLAIGFTDRMIRMRRDAGLLHPRHRGVYQFGPLIELDGGAETAALLAVGPAAALAGRCAAAWWGITRTPPPGPPGPVEVVLPGDCGERRRAGIIARRTTLLTARDVVVRRGLRVTTPQWILLELAADGDSRETERALDEALQTRLVSPTKLRELASRSPRIPGGREVLALLAPGRGRGVTRGEAENRMLEILRQAGLGDAERNARFGEYEIDFLWRRAAVAVEVDSYAWHSGPSAFKRDRRKDAHLRDHGVDVLRVTWEMMDAPLPLAVRIARAVERGAALRSKASR